MIGFGLKEIHDRLQVVEEGAKNVEGKSRRLKKLVARKKSEVEVS